MAGWETGLAPGRATGLAAGWETGWEALLLPNSNPPVPAFTFSRPPAAADGPAEPPPNEYEGGRVSWREAALLRCGATVSGCGEATALGRNTGVSGDENDAAAEEALDGSEKSGIGRCAG